MVGDPEDKKKIEKKKLTQVLNSSEPEKRDAEPVSLAPEVAGVEQLLDVGNCGRVFAAATEALGDAVCDGLLVKGGGRKGPRRNAASGSLST